VEDRFWQAVQEQDVAGLAAALRVGEETAEQVLAPALPVLAQWRQGSREQARIDGWRYRTGWSPITTLDQTPRLDGTWLLVVPDGYAQDPATETLAKALDDYGAQRAVLTFDPAQETRESLADRLGRGEGRP
ncbi:hypothetical protein AB4Z54_71950, partial [Streptomyces sp. MCAF7]